MPEMPGPAGGAEEGRPRLPSEDQIAEAVEQRLTESAPPEGELDGFAQMVRAEPDRWVHALARQAQQHLLRHEQLKRDRNQVLGEYKLIEDQLQARAALVLRELEWIANQRLEAQKRAGVKEPSKSFDVPGAGRVSLRNIKERWVVSDASEALAWLEATEGVDETAYHLTRVELNAEALLEDRAELAKKAGGVVPDGVVFVKERESFSFRPARRPA